MSGLCHDDSFLSNEKLAIPEQDAASPANDAAYPAALKEKTACLSIMPIRAETVNAVRRKTCIRRDRQ
jgi:hypothetical protein